MPAPDFDALDPFFALDALLTRLGMVKTSVQSMAAGASTRKYYRVGARPVGAENGAGSKRTVVAMFFPQGVKTDEIQQPLVHRRWPFLEIADLLRSRGVRVPEVLGEDTERGWILTEDLGEDTLVNYLRRHPEQKDALYTKAVSDLAAAQKSLAVLPEGCVVSSRAFDEALIKGELDHFREWGLEARGRHLDARDRTIFEAVTGRLARRIADFPRGFTHRDYQSRNLMVHFDHAGEVELVWIDFQDALLGPRVYDLVTLLNDSYQDFDRPFIEARLDEYAAACSLGAEERHWLGREFDWVTVQRKLKNAGRFVFIDRVNGNPSFLKFMDATLARAKASLARLGEHDADMRALSEVLARVG